MSSLLSSTERESFTTDINNHFDTFKRTITIHIEGRTNYNNSAPQGFLPGYRAPSTALPTISPSSEDHYAIVTYQDFNDERVSGSGALTSTGKVKIKVKQSTKDYIANNKVIKIVIDGDSFNIVSRGRRANFLNANLDSAQGEIFYIFELDFTK